jgi:hypothetical protein
VDALVVDERAVGGTEVLDRETGRELSDRGVPARDPRIREDDVAALAADRRPSDDGVLPACVWRLLDEDVVQDYRPPGPTPEAMRTICA